MGIQSLADRAEALAEAKEYGEAIRLYDQILAREPADLEALRAKGQAQTSLGQYRKALRTYDTALRHSPDDITVISEMLEPLCGLGWYRRALKVCDGLLGAYRIDEMLPDIYPTPLYQTPGILPQPSPLVLSLLYRKARILRLMGRYDAAIPHYEAILLSEPESDAARLGLKGALDGLWRQREEHKMETGAACILYVDDYKNAMLAEHYDLWSIPDRPSG